MLAISQTLARNSLSQEEDEDGEDDSEAGGEVWEAWRTRRTSCCERWMGEKCRKWLQVWASLDMRQYLIKQRLPS